MLKSGIRRYLVLSIVFLVYSVIAFLLPFSKTSSFWIAYIFGIIAIAYQIYILKISFVKKGDARESIYAVPIVRADIIYLVVQMVLSILEMCFATFVSARIAVIVNILPISIATIVFIILLSMKSEIERQDVVNKINVSNMKNLQSLALSFIGKSNDDDLKNELQRLADEFRYSDPVSSDSTLESENELKELMSELQRALIDDDVFSAKELCKKAFDGLEERNRICALNK